MIAVPPPNVQLEVRDQADGVPVQGDPTLEDAHGRGLSILSAIAERWGVDNHPDDGKTVWAIFPTS